MNAQADEVGGGTLPARVEWIDTTHERWPQVLEMIDRIGMRGSLGIEPDWVPARRVLLVAFVGDRAAGHLSFRLEPVVERASAQRRLRIEAYVDGYAVEEGYDHAQIYNQLEAAARKQASHLRAQAFHTGNGMNAQRLTR